APPGCRPPPPASVPPAFSLASELSSFSTTVLSLRAPSPSPLVACKWKPLAADSESLETEETPVVVPEPVEEQLAASTAAEAAKGEDVFAVVMVGSRQYIVFRGRFIYTQRLKGANVDDKVRGIFIGDCCPFQVSCTQLLFII
ncbi:50S ribosomal protein L21, partial [Musa troglodytarum]